MPEPRLTAGQLRALPVGALVMAILFDDFEVVYQQVSPARWGYLSPAWARGLIYSAEQIALLGVHDGRPTRRPA